MNLEQFKQEQKYSVHEVAELLGWSDAYTLEYFANVDGVLIPNNRVRRNVTIPASVLDREIRRMSDLTIRQQERDQYFEELDERRERVFDFKRRRAVNVS
jgi:hypothetical protein